MRAEIPKGEQLIGKVVLWWTGYSFSVGTESMDTCGWVAVSAPVEVEFTPRPAEDVVKDQLAVVDETEKRLRLEYEGKLRTVAEERASLLALTYEAPTEPETPEDLGGLEGAELAGGDA